MLELLVEKVAYTYARLILTVSDKEKQFLTRYGVQPEKIIVVPNGVDTSTFVSKTNSSVSNDIMKDTTHQDFLTVIFVGNMQYSPNQEAANLITTKVAPEVLSKMQNVRFLLVGEKPHNFQCIGSKIVFTGIVKDVAQTLLAADVAIAPLLHGSGTRLKILEYLSCGLPVVSTSTGAEGLQVSNGVNILIEDNLNNFSTRIVELLKEKKLRERLGNAGRELVIKQYDWFTIGSNLSARYFSILGNNQTVTCA